MHFCLGSGLASRLPTCQWLGRSASHVTESNDPKPNQTQKPNFSSTLRPELSSNDLCTFAFWSSLTEPLPTVAVWVQGWLGGLSGFRWGTA